MLRIKAGLSDKAPSEVAYNNALEDLQQELVQAMPASPPVRALQDAIKVMSTHCFLHHHSGCAESGKKMIRMLLKCLTHREPTSFADVAWLPTESDNQTEVTNCVAETEQWMQAGAPGDGFPVPTYDDTAFDGIRIFIKLLCTKSDYGFAISPLLAVMADKEVFAVVKGLKRVVGSRATEYLRSAAPILRVRKDIISFLTLNLRSYKRGQGNGDLNKLEKAVSNFLKCDLALITLVAFALLSFALFRPGFCYLKGIPFELPVSLEVSSRPLPVDSAKMKLSVPTQYNMVSYSKQTEKLYLDCSKDPALLTSGMAAMRVPCVWAEGAWKSDLLQIILMYVADSALLSGRDMQSLAVAAAVPNRHLAAGGKASDFLFVQATLRSNACLQGFTRDTPLVLLRRDLGERVNMNCVRGLLHLLMGGILACFRGRAEDFLDTQEGSLAYPTPEQLKLLKMIVCHNDFSERLFGMTDWFRKLAANTTHLSMSNKAMTVVNDTSQYRNSLEETEREEVLLRAMRSRQGLRKQDTERERRMRISKAERCWQLAMRGEQKEKKMQDKLQTLMSVSLCMDATKAAYRYAAQRSKKDQDLWVRNQLNGLSYIHTHTHTHHTHTHTEREIHPYRLESPPSASPEGTPSTWLLQDQSRKAAGVVAGRHSR